MSLWKEKDAGFACCKVTLLNKILVFPSHSQDKETEAKAPGILLEM